MINVSVKYVPKRVYKFPYPCSNHSNCEPYYVDQAPGYYLYELWGAGRIGGGGYVSGERSSTFNEKFYIFVGGASIPSGQPGFTFGGYNGGGNTTDYYLINGFRGQAGDGASDIRLSKDDLYSRVIVSGASGGRKETCLSGSFAGGLNGFDGYSTAKSGFRLGRGGSQTKGGGDQNFGTFGFGANSFPSYSVDTLGAGGGGWYGGGAGFDDDWTVCGGGGSSYISGFDGCETSKTGWIFSNPIMKSGNMSINEPSGDTSPQGHVGNGFVRITCLQFYVVSLDCNYFIPFRYLLMNSFVFIFLTES